MLQTFRDNMKGTVAFFLIGLIVVIFALTGIDALFSSRTHTGQVASVNGDEISENELRRNIYIRKQQLIQRFQGQLPASALTDEHLREPVLNDLIVRKVLDQRARDQGMAVATATVDSQIVATPQFQQDGKFSPQAFSQLLKSMGYSPMSYRSELQTDMILNQLTSGIVQSGFVTDKELDQTIAMTHQERDYYYMTLPLQKALETVTVSDDDIAAYYQDNLNQYMSREMVRVNYIDLDVDALAKTFPVSEEEIKQQYDQEMAAFEAKKQRHAAHIMLEGDSDEQRAKLKEIQDKLAAGEDFAALAREYSEDPGSSAEGGDLGFTDGTAFPEAFEKALSELAVGEVSAPVATDAGLHLIKLLEVTDQERPSLAAEHDRIAAAIARGQAENRFVEMLQSLADLTYNAEDLTAAANELGLEVKSSELITRDGGEEILADNRVLSAVFSDEVLAAGHNSEVIELSESHVAVVRVGEHQPVRQQSLEEVRDQVAMDLKRQRAMEALSAQAQDYAKQLEQGETVESLATSHQLAWQVQLNGQRFDRKADPAVADFVFGLPVPAADKPLIKAHQLENGDYILVSLSAVRDGKLVDEGLRKQLRQQLAQQQSALLYGNYQQLVKSEADIEIYP